MHIITRKAALLHKLPKYFTGKPCRNGHMSERYAQSGTCFECVSLAAMSSRKQSSEAVALRQLDNAVAARDYMEREAVNIANRAALIIVKLRIHSLDFPTVRDTITGMGLARFPALGPYEFGPIGKASGYACNTALHCFMVHPDDEEMVRDIANTFFNARSGNGAQVRAVIMQRIDEHIASETQPFPEWKP